MNAFVVPGAAMFLLQALSTLALPALPFAPQLAWCLSSHT